MKIPQLSIGNLALNVPVIQGGMGVGVSKRSLAGAVSAEGALGVIASVGLGEEVASNASYADRSSAALRAEILAVKQRRLPVGVNVMVALTNYASLVRASIEAGADAIISGAGLPLHLPEIAGPAGVKLIPIVSSGRAADIICRAWWKRAGRLPDALVVEGPLAGGHLGFKFEELRDGTAQPLEKLVADVLGVAAVWSARGRRPIPVLAAGGIYTGRDIAGFLKIGAAGVQMGTRFVATHECDAADAYKQQYVQAAREDVILIKSPVGLPARVLKNAFTEASQHGAKTKFSCPYKCLLTCDAGAANYCIAKVLLQASRGHFDQGFAMCGANAWRVDRIVSVHELIRELMAELSEA